MVVKNNIISGFCAMGNLLEGGKGEQLFPQVELCQAVLNREYDSIPAEVEGQKISVGRKGKA